MTSLAASAWVILQGVCELGELNLGRVLFSLKTFDDMLTNISKSKIYEKHKTTNTPAKTPPEAYHFQLNVTAKERNIKRGIGIKMGV